MNLHRKEYLIKTDQLEGIAVTCFEQLDNIAKKLNVKYLVIGATARDLLLHHVHGAQLKE